MSSLFHTLSTTFFASAVLIASLTVNGFCCIKPWRNSDTNPVSEMWSMCSPRCPEVTQNINAAGCPGPLTFGIATIFPVPIFVSTQGMERTTLFSSFFRASDDYEVFCRRPLHRTIVLFTRASRALACSSCNIASSGSFAFLNALSRPLATSNSVASTVGFLLVGHLPTYNLQLAWVSGLGTWLSPSELRRE